MRKISTDDIKTDYITAVAVTGPSGNTLLGKGAKVTPAIGRRLRNWGIMHVHVEGEKDDEHNIMVKKQSPIEIKSELYDMFYGTLDNARMRKLFHAVCEYKVQKPGGA
jgi:hypothetical protein